MHLVPTPRPLCCFISCAFHFLLKKNEKKKTSIGMRMGTHTQNGCVGFLLSVLTNSLSSSVGSSGTWPCTSSRTHSLALATVCLRGAEWCENTAKAWAIDCCSCRQAARSRRPLRRWAAVVVEVVVVVVVCGGCVAVLLWCYCCMSVVEWWIVVFAKLVLSVLSYVA